MALRLGNVLHQDVGLRLGTTQYSAVTSFAPTTWDNQRVTWDGEDIYWYAATETVPTLALARILRDGIRLRLSFSKPVRFGAGGNAGWAVTASGGAVTATYLTGDGSSQLIYSLSREVASTETVTVAYTQPTNGVEDLIGNDLETLADFAVTFPLSGGIVRNIVPSPISSVVRDIING